MRTREKQLKFLKSKLVSELELRGDALDQLTSKLCAFESVIGNLSAEKKIEKSQ